MERRTKVRVEICRRQHQGPDRRASERIRIHPLADRNLSFETARAYPYPLYLVSRCIFLVEASRSIVDHVIPLFPDGLVLVGDPLDRIIAGRARGKNVAHSDRHFQETCYSLYTKGPSFLAVTEYKGKLTCNT
jgi:hypothetical protein